MKVEATAYLERCNGGWMLALAVPAETAILALEMFDELMKNLRPQGTDSEVAAAIAAACALRATTPENVEQVVIIRRMRDPDAARIEDAAIIPPEVNA